MSRGRVFRRVGGVRQAIWVYCQALRRSHLLSKCSTGRAELQGEQGGDRVGGEHGEIRCATSPWDEMVPVGCPTLPPCEKGREDAAANKRFTLSMNPGC